MGKVAARLDAWTSRLVGASADSLPATALYSGDHWHHSLKLLGAATSAGFEPSLWVCSAGYGLVPAEAHLRSYAATFSSGHPDAVGTSGDELRTWWSGLCAWSGHSFESLLGAAGDDTVIIVLSPAYLRAVGADIRRGLRGAAQNVMVVAAGARGENPLESFMVPADARLQAIVGGSRLSLNVRIARYIIQHAAEAEFTRSSVAERLANTLATLQKAELPQRAPLDDAAVRRFIREQLRTSPGSSKSRLLRALREDGSACEQHRFYGLYDAETRQAP